MKKILLFTIAGLALVFSSFGGYHGCCHKRPSRNVLAHCGWHRHSSGCKTQPRRDNRNCNDRKDTNCNSSYGRRSNCNDNSNCNNYRCKPCK